MNKQPKKQTNIADERMYVLRATSKDERDNWWNILTQFVKENYSK